MSAMPPDDALQTCRQGWSPDDTSMVRSSILVLLVSVAGCLGVAHQKVDMPPLLVQGVLLDDMGDPIPEQNLVVALSDFYGNQETFTALRSGNFARDDYGYHYEILRTGSQGEFATRLSGESRYIGSVPPLMNPGEETLRSFVLGLRTPDGVVLAVMVAGTRADVRVPVEGSKLIEPPSDFPFSVTAEVTRSDAIDVLQLTLRSLKESGD